MPKFKFWDIGEANGEITRLETELARVSGELATATTNAKQVQAAAEGLQVAIKQLNSDLATAKQTVGTLQAFVAEKDAALKSLNDKLADPKGEIEARASAKALEIAAAQGAAPISAGRAEGPAGGDALSAQLDAITDPTQRTLFFRKNQAAIKAENLRKKQTK